MYNIYNYIHCIICLACDIIFFVIWAEIILHVLVQWYKISHLIKKVRVSNLKKTGLIISKWVILVHLNCKTIKCLIPLSHTFASVPPFLLAPVFTTVLNVTPPAQNILIENCIRWEWSCGGKMVERWGGRVRVCNLVFLISQRCNPSLQSPNS